MQKAEYEFQQEQQRVAQITAKIMQALKHLLQQKGLLTSEIIDLRKTFWNDVTVNLDDIYELAETYASIKQQAELLSERERSHRQVAAQVKTLIRLKETPYFGRIDFSEGESAPCEKIYIGLASFRDEEKQLLIYDWRAPICSLYYDYPPGPAQFEAPNGVVTGTLHLKRQYLIRQGQIVSLFDTGLIIGDQLLQAVLGKQADTQMKSIVATIQKEQNQIIRNERSPLIVVEGVAGSGKTSAALQRVAYLLYRYRKQIRAENILLFSPNPLFSSYISSVLPELGEENMEQTTFQEYLEQRLAPTFQVENPYTQLEYLYTAYDQADYEERLQGIRYKASWSFLQAIDQYISTLGKEGLLFKSIRFRGKKIYSDAQLAEQFYRLPAKLSIPVRMEQMVAWLLKSLKELARKEREQTWVEEEIQLLDQEVYQQVYKQLRKQKSFQEDSFDHYKREEEALKRLVVAKQLQPIRRRIKELRFIDLPGIYRRLFADPAFILHFTSSDRLPPAWKEICKQTVERLKRRELAYEDATPYLYLKEQIEGFHTNRTIRHILIDEAQDYSPFQFLFIRRLFPNSKLTILGDDQQMVAAHSTHFSLAHLSHLFPQEEMEHYQLKRSYRATEPLVRFTSQLLPQGSEIEAFHRAGPLPTLTCAETDTELVALIGQRSVELQARHQTVAIICKSAMESRDAYEALQEAAQGEVHFQLIDQASHHFEKGVLIIPAYLAKGIEFDAVMIYNASREVYGRELERNLFYTACTRAMHELHLYYVKERSPFLLNLNPNSYLELKKEG